MNAITLHPWERPIGDPLRQDRDIEAQPYDRQEARAAAFLFEAGFGGGDDPIGFLIASGWARRVVWGDAEDRAVAGDG